MKIKVLLVTEMMVGTAAPIADLEAKLDAFREAVLPSDYGITLYQATAEDLIALIGPLWRPVEKSGVTCVRCQRETNEVGDCRFGPAVQCMHTNPE